MTEREQLLRAILSDPEDDTVRLAFADFLDEQGPVRVPCGRCGHYAKPGQIPRTLDGVKRYRTCRFCDGSGTVLDSSSRDRAEFIRGMGRVRLVRQARPITDGPAWGFGPYLSRIANASGVPDLSANAVVIFDRGFVSEVTCTLADFTPAVAAALFAAQPVTRVVLSDREPTSALPNRHAWWTFVSPTDREHQHAGFIPDTLPAFLIMPMAQAAPGGKWMGAVPGVYTNAVFYPTVADALSALSEACVSHGRSLAGLPPLPKAVLA